MASRILVLALAAGAGCFRTNLDHQHVLGTNGPLAVPNLYEADIDTIATGLKGGEFTSVDLVKVSYLFKSY